MRNRGIPIHAVGPAPEKEIARLERVEFEGVVAMAKNGLEISRFAHPNILFAGVTRRIADTIFGKDVMNETGAIHTPLGEIG